MKIFAVSLTVMSLLMAGQYANFRLRKRCESLRNCIVLIDSISASVSFEEKDLSTMFRDLYKREKIKDLYFLKSVMTDEKRQFFDRWEEGLNKSVKKNYFNKDDISLLLSFGSSLGITDGKGQVSNCELHKKLLEKQLAEAEINLKEKSKVNTALSILSGSLFAVFVL